MPLRPAPPQLATLDTKPSWHNRAGRIDRSGCFELRASDLWRYAGFPPTSLPPPAMLAVSPVEPRGPRQSAASPSAISDLRSSPASLFLPRRPRCIAIATQAVTARFLRHLRDYQLPLQLAGDHRTRKSNVMKSRYGNKPYEPAANPNRGATQLKMLGLPLHAWQQTLTIQRWFFSLPPRYDRYNDTMRPHHRLQHFLLCPRCRRKVAKLFLPLCTQEELRDAIIAQQYADLLATHPTTRNAPLTSHEAAIISRYQVLFNPRTLLCRTCLNLRYGEARGRNSQPLPRRAKKNRIPRLNPPSAGSSAPTAASATPRR